MGVKNTYIDDVQGTASLKRLGREPWVLRFNDLMPFRIREILLVSSQYDAFILEEDGPLNERLLAEYSGMNLSFCPRITHSPTTKDGLEQLKNRQIDLVISVPNFLDEMEVNEFTRLVKQENPEMPVVILTFDDRIRKKIKDKLNQNFVDLIICWNGDARILFAIIKLIEDEKNIFHDTTIGGVQAIIVVEDSTQKYSNFLPILYGEIMNQAYSVLEDVLSNLHKLTRIRSRPKILLATTYEKAVEYYEKFENNIFAIITDVRFPRFNVLNPRAGFDLIEFVRSRNSRLPLLIQSAEQKNESIAKDLDVKFLNKNSSTLIEEIRRFFMTDLGFGDFVFRLPNQTEVARARNLYEIEHILRILPAESLLYHANNNDFSTWLKARSMFILASLLKNRLISDFKDVESLRNYLLEVIHRARLQEQSSVIAEFSITKHEFSSENKFTRLGTGSIGGKGRGLAFVNTILMKENLISEFDDLSIKTPRTLVIGTDEFDHFLKSNFHSISEFYFLEDKDILSRFLSCPLSTQLVRDLKITCNSLKGPLAVRSSSLLEDSHSIPLAGIYNTYMIPNNHPDPKVRFNELLLAVKAVYASTFSENAKKFISDSNHTIEDEKMAVVIQEIVGQQYNSRFYPVISGIAMSYNYYPIGGQLSNEGVTQLALGLGQMVVQGGNALRFSPSTPGVLPQFANPFDYVKKTQSKFFALNLKNQITDFMSENSGPIKQYNLEDAELDGTLQHVASVYCAADDNIRENLKIQGPRVISFNNILKWGSLPLADSLKELLINIRTAMGCEVEIEFAVDIAPPNQAILYVLQVRPFLQKLAFKEKFEFKNYNQKDLFINSKQALGHGLIDNIRDIIWVKSNEVKIKETKLIANEIGEITKSLNDENRAFFLIGPGRWGSSDPSLGIPVSWSQISGVALIAETHFNSFQIEPSQGTHFFQNITSQGIGYLTIEKNEIDLDWLERQPSFFESEFIKHIRFFQPLTTLINGVSDECIVLKPGVQKRDD